MKLFESQKKFSETKLNVKRASRELVSAKLKLVIAQKKVDEVKLDLKTQSLDKQKAKTEYKLCLIENNKKTLSTSDSVFIHFHYTKEKCNNIFVKCNGFDADKFLENLLFIDKSCNINNFCMDKVKTNIYTEIFVNQHCENYCDICLIKNQYKYNNRMCDLTQKHSHDCKLISDGNFFYYLKTNLFESVMLYCLCSLMKTMVVNPNVTTHIINDQKHSVEKSDCIIKIDLTIDEKIGFEIDLPLSKCQLFIHPENRKLTWFEPIQLNDVTLIKIINNFAEMLLMISQSKSENIQLMMKE